MVNPRVVSRCNSAGRIDEEKAGRVVQNHEVGTPRRRSGQLAKVRAAMSVPGVDSAVRERRRGILWKSNSRKKPETGSAQAGNGRVISPVLSRVEGESAVCSNAGRR